MYSTRLVIVSESPAAGAFHEAFPNSLRVAVLEGYLTLVGPDGAPDASAKVKLPSDQFLIRKHTKVDLSAWHRVIEWLADLSGAPGFVVFDYDHPLRELALVARAQDRFSYGLFHSSPMSRIAAPAYALLGSSQFNVFFDDDGEKDFRKHYVGGYQSVVLSQLQPGDASTLQRRFSRKPAGDAAGEPGTSDQTSGKRVLIVSYFSGPCRTVGVQRVNYWADQLEALSDGELEVHLATAIGWPDCPQKVHFVPDLETASLLGEEGVFPDWAASFRAIDDRDSKSFNTLSFYWRYALERYFDKLSLSFDAVLISGNPFAVFDFAAYAKRRWGAKVVLDYRDPFANNPRMKYSPAARAHARYTEKGYNLQADVALVVNHDCLEHVVGGDEIETAIIPNGYDERAFDSVTPHEYPGKAINFVHAGSLYYDRSPRPLIAALDAAKHEFHHIGNMAGLDDDLLDHPSVTAYGVQPYSETLSLLSGGDCGVVYLSETAFETPTKVYEYLALGLDILICTHGELKEGALATALSDWPNVHWCKNTEESIAEFLRGYRPTKKRRASAGRFSRRESTLKLIELLQDLTSCGFTPPEIGLLELSR